MQKLIALLRGFHSGLSVEPRRWTSRVLISQEALYRLRFAQEQLPVNVRFVLLRGYEPGSGLRRALRNASRKLGSLIFQCAFPGRAEEACEIFHPNGHDIDGNHIDVGLALNGRRLCTLPYDVFTPARIIARHSQNATVEVAWQALTSAGFRVHRNRTEALQIHCDLC